MIETESTLLLRKAKRENLVHQRWVYYAIWSRIFIYRMGGVNIMSCLLYVGFKSNG
jgi:hypothetical protein